MEKGKGAKKCCGALDFLKGRGRAWLLVLGVVLGAFLLLVGAGFEMEDEGVSQTTDVGESADDLVSYGKTLEDRIEKICSAVNGVSGVEVMVTLEHGYRVLYTTNEKGTPATVGSGSGQQALYQTLCPPSVAGVSVVCHGGNRADVQQRLTDLISTGLGIPSNRVCVAGK